MRTFDPWIGERYKDGGLNGIKVLILGEAHYDAPGRESPDYTTKIVEECARKGRYRFFSVTQRLVMGGRGWLSDDERAAFWDRVAFYNYVQCFPGPRARCRPTPEMWVAAREPFLETLAELGPKLVLVLGRALRDHLPEPPAGIALCAVHHPSYGRFCYDRWQPVVQAALAAAAARDGV